MSSYATEFTHEDSDGDVLWVNRCTTSDKPMMLLLDEGRSGVELYREDVARLATYLAEVIDKVPPRPVDTDAAAFARLTPQEITVSPEAFDALTAELDEPPEPSPQLIELMNRPTPWATETDAGATETDAKLDEVISLLGHIEAHLLVDSYSSPGGIVDGHRAAAGALEAMQYREDNCRAVFEWLGMADEHPPDDGGCGIDPIHIDTADGLVTANPGDWIVRDANGVFRRI